MFLVYRRRNPDGSFRELPLLIGCYSRFIPARKRALQVAAEMPGINVFVGSFREGGIPQPDKVESVPFIALSGMPWTPKDGFGTPIAPDTTDAAGDLPF